MARSSRRRKVVAKKKQKLILAATALCIVSKTMQRQPPSFWQRPWLGRRQSLVVSSTLVQELVCEDPSEYRAVFRMEKESFDYLLNLVRPHIEKEDTILRESVPAKERLEVSDVYKDWTLKAKARTKDFTETCKRT